MSEALDGLIAEARKSGSGRAQSIRSVAGTIRIAKSDAGLVRADAAVRALFRDLPVRSVRHKPSGAVQAPRRRRG